MTIPSVIAVDWSGSLTESARKIWLAAIDPGTPNVLRLESGRDRLQLERHLIESARSNPNIVVGFDFAFSFPEWFLLEKGVADAAALWSMAAEQGEAWLSECAPPFWGRPGKPRPDQVEYLRRTDREAPAIGGITPKSVFQIGGAGAVGTGSVRGMRTLARLKQAGFSVWPFDKVAFPLAVEIYPRLLTGAVTKGSLSARRHFLDTRYAHLSTTVRELGASSEDAFDALVSGLVMLEHAHEFAGLPTHLDETDRREGRIWYPRDTARIPATTAFRSVPDMVRSRPIPRIGRTLEKRHAARRTTQIGFTNRNAQRVVAKTSLEGSDHNQKVYVLQCTVCGHRYGANGSDIHARKCPKHQGGRCGEAID